MTVVDYGPIVVVHLRYHDYAVSNHLALSSTRWAALTLTLARQLALILVLPMWL